MIMTMNPDNNIWNFRDGSTSFGLPMTLRPGMALALLACFFIVCYMITAAMVFFVTRLTDNNPAAGMRIGAMLQDVLLFVVPAVATAMLATRRPAQLLFLMRPPGAVPSILVALILVVSVPFQEAVIYWNWHWDWLPEEIAGLARSLEEAAEASMMLMLEDRSPISLIVNIMIIGIAAGVCEELLFRGAVLGLLLRTRVSVHLSVWIVALLFSAMHMQLFGFVPRMLLGAYFGYLMVWSRSLWLPVLAHVLNNTMYCLYAWWQIRNGESSAAYSEPELWNMWYVAASAVVTALLLWMLWRVCRRADSDTPQPNE